jgi:hypothetical protein
MDLFKGGFVMNRRIKKKKQKLSKMHASKWKDAKLSKKQTHASYIEARHRQCRLIPKEDNYARFLRNRRRYGKIESGMLSAMTCIMLCQAERKEVKKKLFLKEGDCNDG